MCYRVKFGSSAIEVVKEPQKLWSAGTPSPSSAVWLTPENNPHLHMCCHVKFASSVSKGVCINRTEPKKLGSAESPLPCGMGVTDPMPLPTCYSAEFGRSRSNGTSVIKVIRLKT